MNIRELQADLFRRGFSVSDNGKMNYANGSISNYRKCTVYLDYCIWGDIVGEWFYSVRFESFAESGQPEIDHHTIKEFYATPSQIVEFLKGNCILTADERKARYKYI